MADTSIQVVQGMKKYIVFTITDSSGDAVDCSNTTCVLTGGKATNSSAYSMANDDSGWVKSEASSGILKALVLFSTAGIFDFLLKITFTATGVVEETRFTVVVEAV